ncbi:lysine transporter LysE [Brucella endophytica]|uniref:Lysine transporter LysE n=1 Tax=Brucella endophytica TaxID=1963359 RepID=A0A916S4R8_9HYPH|nr:LysE family translocator [Brucella endophytica]GGA84079.1 lysine transporter LysE [Brucella endophytica]
MILSGFVAFSTALAIAAIIPGPQIVAIVAQSVRFGYKPAAWLTAGMVIGDLLYLAMALAGLAYVAEVFTGLLIVIKWAGVAYLCFLAVQFWQARPEVEEAGPAIAQRNGSSLLSGILITVGNPKSVLFYVSILPTVIDIAALQWSDAFTLMALSAVILTVTQYPFALVGARARRSFQSPKALKILNRGAALCIGGAAAAIAARQ